MNKVYKLVWSKVRNCYVAVSEMAKSHTKSPKSGVISRALVCSVLAGLLSIGNLSTAFASVLILPYMSGNPQDTPEYHGLVLNSGYTQLINNSTLVSNPDYADFFDALKNAVGKQYISNVTLALHTDANNNYYIGGLATFNDGTYSFYIPYQEAYDMGLRILPETNSYRNISPFSSFAYGNGAKATEDNSIAVGTGAKAEIENSIALGTGSVANESYTLSVGSNDKKYRIVNVADGVADSDAATVGQLKSMSGGSLVHGVGVNNITESSANYNGEGAMGVDSIAIGDAKAAGGASVAIGAGAIATGNNSIAFGTNATATGDGMTREQVNSILSNNKAIRDALNDARAGYTQSKADYDRQKEIWEGQNEAVARVNHANELINGYQQEIDSTLKPNADAANETYNTAKTDYDTLYNDFQNRLAEIKYIDFTVYADGSAAGYDYDRMSSDLKTKVETGTSFNMPVSFYNDYIHNYVKANGDLRLTQKAADILNYLTGKSSQKPYSEYTFTLNGISLFLDKKYYSVSDMTNASKIEKYLQCFDSNFSINDLSFKYFNSDFFDVYSNGYYGDSGSGMIDYSSAVKFFNNLLKTKVFSDSERNVAYENIDSIALNNKNLNSIIANELVNINQMTSEERDNYVQFYNTTLDKQVALLKSLVDVGYYQKKYEDTGDIAYIGNKEIAIKTADEILKSGEAFAYAPNGIDTTSNQIDYSSNNDFTLDYAYARYLKANNLNVPSVMQAIARYCKENITDVQDATVVALKAVTDGLEGQLAEKKQALDEATVAKNAADKALADKQKQIADTTPSQQDLDDASAAEQSAQDLQQKKDKLDADLEALNQAKANLENLENIAGEGESPIAIGNNALVTGKNAVGLGRDSLVTGEDGVGIGRNTVVSGKQSIGIGADNSISKDNAIAIGTNNGITGASSIAIGNNNVISGENSIAIGNNLNVSENNVVALGGKKVSGVTDGVVATDAATVGQTYELVAGSGVRIEEDGINDIGQKKYKLSSTSDGASYTAGNNISIENDVVSAVGLIKYDDETKKVASLEGGNRGTKLTNLSAGTLSKTSTDAVIGNQLWTTNQNMIGMQTNISTNTANIASLNTSVSNALESVTSISGLVDTVNTLKADKSLNNLDDAGKQVIATAAANAVQEYMAGNNKVVPMNKVVMNNVVPDDWSSVDDELALKADKDSVYTKDETDSMLDTKADVSYVDDQLSAKANIDDVYMKDEVDTLLDTKANVDDVYSKSEMDNALSAKADVTYVDDELSKKADKIDLEAKADKDASNIDVNAWANKLGTGSVEEGNTGLVNGGTVYDAISQINQNNGLIKEQDGVLFIGSETGGNVISIYNNDGEGRVITGVMTNPEDPSSAANVGYVNAVAENATNQLRDAIGRVDSRIDKVGAQSAALAGLHPFELDGNQKWNIAAAYGGYKSEKAGAVGLFYKPSGNVLVSASSTIGDDSNMYNVGVSVSLDKGNIGMTKAQLVKTVQQQNDVISKQNERIAEQDARIARLEAAMAKQK